MKAAILLCTHDKNDCLPNTLTGLASQQTLFETQTIILDDCSPESPEGIVREFLPGATYIPLKTRTGGRFTRTLFFEHLDDDVDTLMFLSSDIIMLQPRVVNDLCGCVGKKVFTMGQVKDHYVLPTAYLNYEFFRDQMLDMWDVLPGGRKIYSGTQRPDGKWFLFMGAIRRDDAVAVGMSDTGCCDAIIDKRMREYGMLPVDMDMWKGIHQAHTWVQYPCPSLSDCEYKTEFRCVERGITQA